MVTFTQGIRNSALTAWAHYAKGGIIEFEIQGLWKASRVLAGRAVFVEQVKGKAVFFGHEFGEWKPLETEELLSVAKSVDASRKLHRFYNPDTPCSALITFPTDPAKIRDFFRVALRTGVSFERAGEISGAKVSFAPTVEWNEAKELMQGEDLGLIARYLTGLRDEAESAAHSIINVPGSLGNGIWIGNRDEHGLFSYDFRLTSGTDAVILLSQRGFKWVGYHFEGIRATSMNGGAMKFLGEKMDQTLRLLEAIGPRAFGKNLGTFTLPSGAIIEATINQFSLGDIFINIKLVKG
jgi:hypothetical protein